MSIDWLQAKRILIVRLDNLGDVVLATPAIRAIKETLPECQITLLASPVGAQVAEVNPDIDSVIIYSAPWMDPWQRLPQDSAREMKIIEQIRNHKFDGAIIFTSYHQSPLPAAYLCYLADVPLRLGSTSDGAGSLLTTRHKPPTTLIHEVERGLELVSAVGFSGTQDDLVIEVPSAFRRAVRGWLEDMSIKSPESPLVVIHPGCSMPARTYPWQSYAQVADLIKIEMGAEVVFTGAETELDLLTHIKSRMATEPKLFYGRSLPELCALIEHADLVITNNTGPMHLAAALKTPVVALFALTNPPEQWRPWKVPHKLLFHEVDCRICYSRICPFEHECLAPVSPQEVLQASIDLLQGSAQRRIA
ncbi:glycosyl transferase family 9 [Thermobaculum terrenum ATCC BAA-798]|uniref:Glycosyl transferase family 9 n=1 Tax=Thermobaculum terrenum (strain ATCC BAA-798 / CCMEE 7001 / YNP1) TaxID=525904 RepID=D1CDR3_THET1|nr:glycosyltransferase family 9 protein [Thermobaculum terrenum]ACZ41069.1 glycosyl transferase family 9 [Thermobaculum terrenum ATCC BAA-798]